ncbi:MAG: hypothetical protein ACRCUE_18055 [Bosea sp. (in: a-proteobacteria)]
MDNSLLATHQHVSGPGGLTKPSPRQSSVRARLATAASVAAYLLFCAMVILNGIARPIAGWDMLAYTATVLERRGVVDPVDLHAQTYATVRAAVTAPQWHELTTQSHYRIVQARDAQAFVSMLPMYQVKGGYVTLVAALASVTGPVAAMRAISLVSIIGLMAVLFWAFWRLGQLQLVGLLTPVMSLLRFPDLASLGAPDPAVAFLATAATCLIIVANSGRVPLIALCLLVGSVLLRPDMLVATTGLPLALVAGSVFAAVLNGESSFRALRHGFKTVGVWPWTAAFAGLAAYAVAKAGVPHPGWFAHFMFSFHDQRDTMVGFQPAFDLKIYVSALARVSMRLLREEVWPWLVVGLMICGVLIVRLRDAGPTLLGMIIFILGVWMSRTLVFPLPDSRVATPQVLTAVMVAVALIARAANDVLARQRA